MANPTEPSGVSEQAPAPVSASASAPSEAAPSAPAPVAAAPHPRGYTMADEEMERLEQKRARGNVLDPIALNDPTGQSVEKVILRVGATVAIVLVVGILLAQIACKNIQLSGIPDFSTTAVSGETVDKALRSGIMWGGEIVRFSDNVAESTFDRDAATVTVKVYEGDARTVEQLAASAQSKAVALAMNLFRDQNVRVVRYVVQAPVSTVTGAYAAGGGSNTQTADLLTIVWQRTDSPGEDGSQGAGSQGFTCSVTGFDPMAASLKAGVEDEKAGA